MFSGIIKAVGRLLESVPTGGDRRVVVGFPAGAIERPELGASIAVNGVCLTVVDAADDRFSADVSSETLARTTLAALAPGEPLNLEPALRVGDPLDGHLVSGHVAGIGRVVSVAPAARSLAISIELPPELARYVARKGSVAVDGVSLTVNAISGHTFDVNIVPHTRDATIIGRYRVGTAVNIEVDMLARYVERMLDGRATT